MKKSEQLKLYINYFNLTQDDMGIVLGVTGSAVSMWLSGKREPPEIYLRILKYFYKNNLNIKELLK